MPKQPDFGAILKQAQQMQADMAMAQEELKNETVEATVGGGMISVKMSGDLDLQELKIDPQAVDPEDVDMLQDLVLAAVNEAIRSAQELAAAKMNAAAGGLGGLGGGLGLPGMVHSCGLCHVRPGHSSPEPITTYSGCSPVAAGRPSLRTTAESGRWRPPEPKWFRDADPPA